MANPCLSAVPRCLFFFSSKRQTYSLCEHSRVWKSTHKTEKIRRRRPDARGSHVFAYQMAFRPIARRFARKFHSRPVVCARARSPRRRFPPSPKARNENEYWACPPSANAHEWEEERVYIRDFYASRRLFVGKITFQARATFVWIISPLAAIKARSRGGIILNICIFEFSSYNII